MSSGQRDGLPILLAIIVVTAGLWGMTNMLEAPKKPFATQQPAAPQPQHVATPPPSAGSQRAQPFVPAPPPEAYTGSTPAYRCAGGGYSDRPCGGAAVDTRGSSGIQFATPEEMARARGERRVQSTTIVEYETKAVPAAPRVSQLTQCKQLDEAIALIDARARQPNSLVEQDRLRVERARLVDRKYALKCHEVQ